MLTELSAGVGMGWEEGGEKAGGGVPGQGDYLHRGKQVESRR